MRIGVIKRQEPWKRGSFFILIVALLLSLLFSGILLQLQGKSGITGIVLLFQGAFGSVWSLEDCLNKAIPIFLCSMGVACTFRLQVWNIGAEGQFALGAVGTTLVFYLFPSLPGYLMIPLMLIMAGVLGGLWGYIPALLKLKCRANEIIVTLMMNYIGILFLEYLVYGPWKDPASFGFPMTAEFTDNGIVGLIPGTNIHWGLVFCIAMAATLGFLLRFSRLGFELKVSGQGIDKARYARMRYGFLVTLVMVVSGAMAGWAGFFETSAVTGRLEPNIMAGYGYTAIVVAWLARLHPISIGIASFLLAGLRVGVENLQLELQVPAAFGGIMEGLILMFVLAGQFFYFYSLRITHSNTVEVGQDAD